MFGLLTGCQTRFLFTPNAGYLFSLTMRFASSVWCSWTVPKWPSRLFFLPPTISGVHTRHADLSAENKGSRDLTIRRECKICSDLLQNREYAIKKNAIFARPNLFFLKTVM